MHTIYNIAPYSCFQAEMSNDEVNWKKKFTLSMFLLSVTTKRNISAYDYFIGSQQIPRTDNQDYLGVTINSKLLWPPHINKVQNKTTWLTQKNTACGATTSETNGTRGTRATNTRVCHMRLSTSHKDRHSDNRARTKIRCAVCHRWLPQNIMCRWYVH